MKLDNPFADYGGIVNGERFIGRTHEIEAIRNRLLGTSFGNIGIMGLPRIGKSSLAWNAVMSIKPDLVKNKIIPIWISFGQYSSLNEMFEDIFFEIPISIPNNSNLNEISDAFLSSKTSIEKRRYIKKYFKFLRNYEYRIILIVDEFDNSANILSLQDFQFFRELSYNLETKLGLLTISRKTIQELEPENGSLSNFYQIFTDLRLKMFSDDDLSHYWHRIRRLDIEVSEEYKSRLKFYSGAHPFLLDMINHLVFNGIEEPDINLDQLFQEAVCELKLKIYNEYEAIIKLIKFEGLDRALMQMVVGPVYDINIREMEKLLKYNLVCFSQDNTYVGFSTFFTDYLNLKTREIDIWPLWSEVENEIRTLIKHFLKKDLDEDWISKYENSGTAKEQLGRKEFIKLKKDLMLKNVKSFGDKASTHLVDYTYPMDMFDRFIAIYWHSYKPVFGKEKNDWKPIFEHLGKIRNPLAHNNPNFLSDSDKNIADGYCKMILEKIKEFRTVNP